MSEAKVYRIFGKEWSAETCYGEELDCNYKTEFVLKSDYDRLRAQLERVVKTISLEELDYLSNGGLYNPEDIDPEEVGQALLEIAKLARQVAKEEGIEI